MTKSYRLGTKLVGSVHPSDLSTPRAAVLCHRKSAAVS